MEREKQVINLEIRLGRGGALIIMGTYRRGSGFDPRIIDRLHDLENCLATARAELEKNGELGEKCVDPNNRSSSEAVLELRIRGYSTPFLD